MSTVGVFILLLVVFLVLHAWYARPAARARRRQATAVRDVRRAANGKRGGDQDLHARDAGAPGAEPGVGGVGGGIAAAGGAGLAAGGGGHGGAGASGEVDAGVDGGAGAGQAAGNGIGGGDGDGGDGGDGGGD